ncbi:hypothetical protein BJ138DRAFT_1103758 [Hygrophoropsis aurantiaca]|uniref:Uncharacterized protein n=1 Tax=Hygrophoropsis aurantiaca TaxID=72124 RepID=A0ACB8A643_9AGAM|nr:hypothetical protein BJ138DRAFT_1103758 [Hygrophoropsis aurantiaca]
MAVTKALECSRPNCSQTFTRMSDLKKHELAHTGMRTLFACPFTDCKFLSLQKKNLEIHFARHTGEKRHRCPEVTCGFRTADPAALTRHPRASIGGMRRNILQDGAQSDPFLCDDPLPIEKPQSNSITKPTSGNTRISMPDSSEIILPKPLITSVTEPDSFQTKLEDSYVSGPGYDTYMNPHVFFPSPFSPLPTDIDPAHAIAGPTELIGLSADPDSIFPKDTVSEGLCPEWLHMITHTGIPREFVLEQW